MQRYQVINSLLRGRDNPTYVEIGLATGDNWFRISAPRKIGVEPRNVFTAAKVAWYRKLLFEISRFRGARFFAMTSDDFFKQRAERLFSTDKIDVVFIDGWHSYEQSLKDVLNSLCFLKENGVIVVHDCNPAVEAATAATPEEALKRPGSNGKWNGDVWKTIVRLRSTGAGLDICVLDCDEGLGIIRLGKPDRNLNFSVSDIDRMTYADLSVRREEILNLKAC